MRQKARTPSTLRGRTAPQDEIRISRLMSKVNGAHEQGPKYTAAPQVVKNPRFTH
jgi:hypothetical protein